jgi:hypothetical protein
LEVTQTTLVEEMREYNESHNRSKALKAGRTQADEWLIDSEDTSISVTTTQ